MSFNYFILQTSNASLVKRFRSLQWLPLEQKRQTIAQTDAGLSVVSGTPVLFHQIIAKVYETETDPLFGNVVDLQTFFRLNDPSGTPSSTITYTDYYGTSYYVKMLGDWKPVSMSTLVQGTGAIYTIPINLLIMGEVI